MAEDQYEECPYCGKELTKEDKEKRQGICPACILHLIYMLSH